MVRRDGWDLDQAALCVAALYEIDELIGDLSASPDAFSESSIVADSAKENNEDNSAVDDAEPKTEEVSNKAPERKPMVLELSFHSKRKGLVFSTKWLDEKGLRRFAYGDRCVKIADLLECEREKLLSLAGLR